MIQQNNIQQSKNKLKLAIAIFGFLTLGFSSVAPPLFFVIFLYIAAFLSLIALIINLIKGKVDIVPILMLAGVVLMYILLFSPSIHMSQSATFYAILSFGGISFVLTASILSLIRVFRS